MKLFTSLLLLASVSSAEAMGSLSGSVRTRDGAPLPHVVLVVAGPTGPLTVVTGPEGRYRALALAPGAYTVTVEQPGFVLDPAATATVAQGDTLAAIAQRFGTTVPALQAANGIDDPDEIVIGQVLVIP